MSSPLVIFLHSASYDRLFQAANLLVTASSMGRPCYLFLFYGALATYVDGSWDETGVDAGEGAPAWARVLARSLELGDTPSLYELIDMAKGQSGGLTVCACSTSMNLMGLEPKAVGERVDRILGHAAMLDIASRTDQILYI
jgi:peroxiredoxin family protein